MKKLLIVLFVMLLAFAMFSCGNTPEGTGDSSIPSSTDNSVNGDAPHTHAYGEWAIVIQATCTAMASGQLLFKPLAQQRAKKNALALAASLRRERLQSSHTPK